MRSPRVLLAAVALAACASPAPQGLTAADSAAIRSASDAFIRYMLAGQPDSVSLLYTADASLMPANSPEIRGRDAIRQYFASFPPIAEAALINDTVVGLGDVAYVKGRYRARFQGAGAGGDSGKFVEIRRRAPDGTWPFFIEIFNSDVALPAPAPR